ncbi:MAG: BACON domain-containing protein [bacterium]|nr:BACON domain-containing protein [Candidatus Limimorpha caballi]
MSLTVTKNGTTNYAWSVPANTGRNQKTFTGRTKSVNSPSTYVDTTFRQPGKAEFVQLVSSSAISVSKNGTTKTITVLSNSSRLNVELLRNSVNASVGGIIINNVSYVNNSQITGDPGADEEYEAVITVNFNANTIASAKGVDVKITDNAGHSVICSLTQEAQTASITVSQQTVSVPASGGSGSINVTANDTWTVEAV